MPACCTAGQLFASTGHLATTMRSGIISSCQSAATSKIVKALLSMCSTCSSAVSSTGPIPLLNSTPFKNCFYAGQKQKYSNGLHSLSRIFIDNTPSLH